MTLYEEFKEKYLRDDLIDFFIEKRKFVLENKKKDYLNYLIKECLLEEDIINVAKMSLDFFVTVAQTILIHDREIFNVYSNLDEKQRPILLSEIYNRLCCMVLNQVTYNVELEY